MLVWDTDGKPVTVEDQPVFNDLARTPSVVAFR